MAEYSCLVELLIGGNNHEAKNQVEYREKVKAQYIEEHNITLNDSEIKNIHKWGVDTGGDIDADNKEEIIGGAI
jgi:hypothetical protein